jgi:hypothetical protein
VLLDLCADAAKRSFTVSFGVGSSYTNAIIAGVRPGRQEVILDFTFEQAANAAVGVVLNRSAFHGSLRLLGVWFHRLDLAPIGEP